ncbi:hypothetical protein [Lachnobacterium bovis]|uniref:Uncharacterized protein n=1 Tax=Lachnobacterium bovis TaxID=140626 RepID=A0A1H9SLP0_9FIRM|nr:hypothetical protein [Lachnobacterium bovis]SER85635.1 hypothetical protein SAMN02910429_01256 [Lachnobacterium bovis]
MAKYIVEETKTSKYEKNFKFPMINLLPAIVWCIPVHQKLSPIVGTAGTYGVVAAFFAAYILLSYVPIIALAPSIASVIMLTGLFWVPADHIGNNVVRIIVKGVILVIMVLIEACVLINATLPWLERKTALTPRVRRIDDQEK